MNTQRRRAAALCAAALASLPAAACAQQGMPAADWYAFTPKNDAGPSAIGMEEWHDRPAGRAGRITRQGEKLVYAGKPVKLWGINLCYGNCAPDKALADKRAAFYAKFGVNAVRLHKFADGAGWSGIQSEKSCVQYDPAALDRMDYQVAQFKKAGIYVLLSANFGVLGLGPDDRTLVPYMDEFGKLGGDDKAPRVRAPHSALFYSPELQKVQTLQVVNLLKHKNPYTGLTYAEDPAVAFVEAANEQSALFYTTLNALKQSATLRRIAGEQFSDWLKARYGTQEKLTAAWGKEAFDSFTGEGFTVEGGESLDRRNVLPLGNPWYWDPAQIHGSQKSRARRLLDTMEFLGSLQTGFYSRFAAAVRDAGYKGEVLGSNWQAGRAYSHLTNLRSDYETGTIDRHNYFGGGSGKPGEKFNAATMLRAPGTELLSTGLQQVADRPFMLSEWIHVYPNEWGVEGPAILGAYGYGLQGWDVSFMFQNGDSGGFSERIGRDAWDVTAPQVLGVFPAVARQVLRGDVKEATASAPLYAHVPSLGQGKLGYDDKTVQAYDLKGFDTDKVPAKALAVARVAVSFTDAYKDTPAFDLSPYEKDGALVSSTGQLRWTPGTADAPRSGYFTVDTPGTKAVVGFAPAGRAFALGGVTLTPQSPFGAVYVTAKGPGETVQTAKSLVVVALARARNTGMRLNAEENAVVEKGGGPVLLEPVQAEVALPAGRAVVAVHVLDHDGRRTGKTLPVTGGRFTLDGARDKTPYYEVELK